jgi:hypothetical protein
VNNPDAVTKRPFAHTIDNVVQEAGCGRTTIYAAIKAGQLKARKIGRRTVILDQDLCGWLISLPTRLTSRP